MDTRTLNALEFGKVLEHLAAFCFSTSGKAKALSLHPFDDISKATQAAQLYTEFQIWYSGQCKQTPDQNNKKKSFQLTAFPDISGIETFLSSKHRLLDLDALWTLRQVVQLAEQARISILPNHDTNSCAWPSLLALVEACPLPEQLSSALKRCISDDGQLRDESSPELLLVRSELRRIHQSCLRKVKDFAAQYNIGHYLQDDFMTLASDRYVLPLKANFKGRLQGIVHHWSQTGETCFFEPMFLVEINNRLQDLKREEREEERKILEYLTNMVRDNLELVQNATYLLTELDVLSAMAQLAQAMSKNINTSAESICINLVDCDQGVYIPAAHHPLLALAGTAQPINITLESTEKALVISGGNAGGKTVCLKTLGLVALMGMSGLPVPVGRGAYVPAWTHMHAFIGDEQSLDDQVSTFTAQIRHLASAWEYANKNSLILLDEFGAGTDPTQGAALAQAVLDALIDKGVTVIAATHFPALKTYALGREKTKVASVLFDPNTKRPLFRLAYDQVGASQALDVAREHGLPESIIRRAEQYLLLEGEDSSALLERLNSLAVQRETELTKLKEEQEQARTKQKKLQERLERERKELYTELRTKAQELMHAWKAGKVSHKQALKNMSSLRAEVAQTSDIIPQAKTVVSNLHVGQEVLHSAFNKKGTICQIDTRKERVRLEMGGVTLWADNKDIALSSAPKASRDNIQGVILTTTKPSGPLMRLDLRGQRAEVALGGVGDFLDKAILNGRDSVEIVHGRGTGVLRKEVHNFLRTFPGIDSFELANEDTGGDGMTIVYLR